MAGRCCLARPTIPLELSREIGIIIEIVFGVVHKLSTRLNAFRIATYRVNRFFDYVGQKIYTQDWKIMKS